MIIDVDIYQQIREMTKKYCDGNNVPWERKKYTREAKILTDEYLTLFLNVWKKTKKKDLINNLIPQDEFITDLLKKWDLLVVNPLFALQ